MLAAVVLATWWAQAEPAPPEPPSVPSTAASPIPQPEPGAAPPVSTLAPAPSAPLPAAPPPAMTPEPPALLTPAPPQPAPPAPAATPPSATAPTAAPVPAAPLSEEPVTPPNTFGLHGRLAYRVGSEGQSVGPATGFSLGGSYERRTATMSSGQIEFGWAVDFFFDRFASSVSATTENAAGEQQAVPAQRTLSETSFVVLKTAAARFGSWRAFAGGGVGLSIAYFSSPEAAFAPGSFDAVQPVARVAAGVEVAVARRTALTLRGEYTYAFTRPTFTTADGQVLSFLGDVVDVGLGLLFQF